MLLTAAPFVPTLWPTVLAPLLLVAGQLLASYRKRPIPYPVWMSLGASAVTLGESIFSWGQTRPDYTYLTLGCWLLTACMLGIDQVLVALAERRQARALRGRERGRRKSPGSLPL